MSFNRGRVERQHDAVFAGLGQRFKIASIRPHCRSFSQNKPARILSPPNQKLAGEGITWRYLGTGPRTSRNERRNHQTTSFRIARATNELDRWRIVRALTKRERYRYDSPKVTAVAGGYLVESPCCSGNINAEGGLIDVALLHHDRTGAAWQLFRKDHGKGAWEWHSTHQRLGLATAVLNADPERLFWQ